MRMPWVLGISLVAILLTGCQAGKISPVSPSISIEPIILPAPRLTGPLSLEESLNARRSVRQFSDEPLALLEVSQLLWAAQGITSADGARTAPSAGGLYPLEISLIAGTVKELPAGYYRYYPHEHKLIMVSAGDLRQGLSTASLGQKPVADGAIDIVISAVYERTTQKYGERGIRYTDMEAGHAAQNIALQAVALKLGAVTIGAFNDDQVKELLDLGEELDPLYILPVGHPLK